MFENIILLNIYSPFLNRRDGPESESYVKRDKWESALYNYTK